MHPLHALQQLSGAARWGELRAHGVAARELRLACDTGAVVSLGQGLYCRPGHERLPVTRAVALCGVLSCGSAAEHHDEMFGRSSLHVTLRRTPPLVQAGVGSVASQVHVPRVGWVDLVIDGWLVVETDGRAVHLDTFAEDRRRDAELVRAGFVVLGFNYADVERRPQWVVQVVRAALRHRSAGHGTHRRALEW